MEQLDIKMQSDSLEEFAKAMCEVQKNDLFAKAESENPYYKSRFANLPSVWKTIRKPLTDNGFSVIQSNMPFEGGVAIMTTLLHVSGQWMRGILPMPSEKRTPQAFGSVMSFERRYALMAIVGVSTADDDDDAESAMPRDEPITKQQTKKVSNKKSTIKKTDVSKTSSTGLGMVDYTMPGEDSEAFVHLKEYRPDVVILNKDKTRLKVGKYIVETNENGSKMWADIPKFGSVGFQMGACVPCLIAALLRKDSVPFVEGKYGLKFISEVKNDE